MFARAWLWLCAWVMCRMGVHRWEWVWIDGRRMLALAHLHPDAGCMGICLDCLKLWDDVPRIPPAAEQALAMLERL